MPFVKSCVCGGDQPPPDLSRQPLRSAHTVEYRSAEQSELRDVSPVIDDTLDELPSSEQTI
jgi:hypothetical protein